MTLISFDDVNKLREARLLSDKYRHVHFGQRDGELAISAGGLTSVRYPSGLVRVMRSLNRTTSSGRTDGWPSMVSWMAFTNPRKEYAVIEDLNCIKRYWVIPPEGLLLMPHPDLRYVPVEPVQDYKVSVDVSKTYRLHHDHPLYERIISLWTLIETEADGIGYSLNLDEPNTWYKWIRYQKTCLRTMKYTLDRVTEALGKVYKFEPIPPTTYHHGDHSHLTPDKVSVPEAEPQTLYKQYKNYER